MILSDTLMLFVQNEIDAIIKGTLQEDVRSLAGVPSWMLTLMNKLLETTGKNYIDEIENIIFNIHIFSYIIIK